MSDHTNLHRSTGASAKGLLIALGAIAVFVVLLAIFGSSGPSAIDPATDPTLAEPSNTTTTPEPAPVPAPAPTE